MWNICFRPKRASFRTLGCFIVKNMCSLVLGYPVRNILLIYINSTKEYYGYSHIDLTLWLLIRTVECFVFWKTLHQNFRTHWINPLLKIFWYRVRQDKWGAKHLSVTKIKVFRAIFRTIGSFKLKICFSGFQTPCQKYFGHTGLILYFLY